jgi:hypothetical protein
MMDKQFQVLNAEDMISITHNNHILGSTKNLQTQELYKILRANLKLTDEDKADYDWLGDGIEVRLLQASKSNIGWVKGRARLSLAFRSDQIQSLTEQLSIHIPEYDDVLEIEKESARLTPRQSELISDIISVIRQKLCMADPALSQYYWINRGIECEVLKSSGEVSGWQSGLICLQLEFMPTSAHNIIEHAANSATGLDGLRQTSLN